MDILIIVLAVIGALTLIGLAITGLFLWYQRGTRNSQRPLLGVTFPPEWDDSKDAS